jgi:tetratricopeptide (TPR) repeat protein
MKNDDSSRSQIEGDRNQVIATNLGTAIGNVEGSVFLNQPPPRALSLYQLPADVSDFTGRKDEIEGILGHLNRGETVAISAVAGMPGVGKSALAIHVAHRLAVAAFPDVQLYIDLRGADGNALEPEDVLAQWLRAFGLDESSIPKDLRERSSVFRSLLSGKRAIIVVDNARDEVQVRPLLPGSQTCVAIVTSRKVLGALEGAAIIHLEVLPETEALELLERLIGETWVQQELAAAKEIVQLCGRLPLAIRIVGGTLKTKRHWHLSDYAKRLTDEKQRLNHLQLSDLDVRASFELSYRDLKKSDKTLFCRLGLLEDRKFVVSIVDVLLAQDDENKNIEAIERLVDLQLLEANGHRRYQFHDLIQIFAHEKLIEEESEQDQEEIRLRLIIWYEEWSLFYDACLEPVTLHNLFPDIAKAWNLSPEIDEEHLSLIALNWFEGEYAHILAAIKWANKACHWPNVVAIASHLTRFFNTRSHWEEWVKTHKLALKAAQKVSDVIAEGDILNSLSLVYHDQRRLLEALECVDKSLVIYNHLKNYLGIGCALNNRGRILESLGQLYEARESYKNSISIFQEHGDKQSESNALNNLGHIHLLLRQYQDSICYLEKSLNLRREINHVIGEGLTLLNLGNVYIELQNLDLAKEYLIQSLLIYRKTKNQHWECIILKKIGDIFLAKLNYSEAYSYYSDSLSVSIKLGDLGLKGSSLASMANLFRTQKLYKNAIETYKQCITVRENLGDRFGVAQSLGNLGLSYREAKSWEDAIKALNHSIEIFQELGEQHSQGISLATLGDLYEEMKYVEKAIDIWEYALTKLHPNSPHFRGVTEWSQAARSSLDTLNNK